MQDTVARLPTDLRDALKEPLGPVVEEVDTLLAAGHGPIVAIGDIVTFHLLEAGVSPAVAVVDGRTERSAVDASIRDALPLDVEATIPNDAGTLSAELLTALTAALTSDDDQVLVVDGEEDLAALPAIVAAPDDALVVYGQPGAGMVKVVVDADTRARARALLDQFETTEDFWTYLP